MVSEEDPSTYTLVALDKSLALGKSSIMSSSRPEFKDIAPFLNPKIWEDPDLFDSSGGDRFIEVANKEDYCVVRMMKSATPTKAERLVSRLIDKKERKKGEASFQSALLFFPQKKGGNLDYNQMLVYCFGQWNGLINNLLVVPQWGLRVLASNDFADPHAVKSVKSRLYRSANPSSTVHRVDKLADLDIFSMEVGSENLEHLRLLPAHKYQLWPLPRNRTKNEER